MGNTNCRIPRTSSGSPQTRRWRRSSERRRSRHLGWPSTSRTTFPTPSLRPCPHNIRNRYVVFSIFNITFLCVQSVGKIIENKYRYLTKKKKKKKNFNPKKKKKKKKKS